MHSYIRIALDILFPALCVACETPLSEREEVICAECLTHIPLFGWRLCPQCGTRLPAPAGLAEGTLLCHPEARVTLIAATSYAVPEVRALLKALKYHAVRRAAVVLAMLTIAAARDTLEQELLSLARAGGPARAGGREPWVMVPIPLHPRRERERGFNQSALLAEACARHEPLRNVPIVHALRRIRYTDTQTEMPNDKARRVNVAGCFAVTREASVRGNNILIIEDVSTSGATLEEAAKTLKSSGAKRITALVFAKA